MVYNTVFFTISEILTNFVTFGVQVLEGLPYYRFISVVTDQW